MSRKDHLLYKLKFNQQVMKKLLDDITEEESMVRGEHGQNHIRWLAGHIFRSDLHGLIILGIDDGSYEKYGKLFGMGSVISDDPKAYPSMAEVRKMLYKSHDRLFETISKSSDADLEKQITDGGNKRPAWQALTFLAMHEFYHAGQIVYIRKLLGRDRPFA